MAEKWVLKTFDGEEFNLRVTGDAGYSGYDGIYSLLIGTIGHMGTPVSIQSDVVPNIAGSEFRNIVRGDRTVYLPLAIIGKDPADFHKNLAKLRKSMSPENEAQLWVTNNEGETKVLYCRYLKGFEAALDDDKRGPTWIKIPLYVLAEDPYWYDVPGAEISRNFSSDPWTSPFFTFTVPIALTSDALTGDTRVTLTNTANCVAGKEVEIRGSKIITSDELGFDGDELIRMGKRVGNLRTTVPTTSISIAVDNTNPQLNQSVHISGIVTTADGSPVTAIGAILLYITGGIATKWNLSAITDGRGRYSFTIITDKDGPMTFQARYLADEVNYATSWSDILTINSGITAGTALTLVSNIDTPMRLEKFILSGTLSIGATGLQNQPITLYKASPSGNVEVGSAITNQNGDYSINYIEDVEGWVSYDAVYAGNAITSTNTITQIQTAINATNTNANQNITQTQNKGDVTGSGNVINFASQDQSQTNNVLYDSIISTLEGTTSVATYGAADAKLTLNIGNVQYPINYQVALPASMINDGEVQYFGSKGFNGVILIAETTTDDYAAELAIIKAQGLWPAIDISVVTDVTYPLSHWDTWLESLVAAGWEYVAGINSTGRTGDPAHLVGAVGFTGYINYSSTPRGDTSTNPDSSGVYRNSFRCFDTAEIPYIEAWDEAAYADDIKSGLVVGVLADSKNNQMLTNSVADAVPSYQDILDWSYINSVGMTNFVVWFPPKYNAITARDSEPEQIDLYKSLGLDTVVTNLMEYYPATDYLDGHHYTWEEPSTTKAVDLTIGYTDIPLVFTGVLSKLTTGDFIAGKTITLQESTESNITADVASGKAVKVESTVGFLAGDEVVISSMHPFSQTNHIATGGVNATTNTLTMTDTIAYNFTVAYSAKVALYGNAADGWLTRGTAATTDSTGTWTVSLTGAYAVAAGKHQFRAKFAASSPYLGFIAPSDDGMTMYHAVYTESILVEEINTIESVDNSTVLTLTDPLVNDYLVSSDAYITEVDTADTFFTPTDTTTRTVNADCTLLQFWIPGCPPCYAAMAQLNALVADYPTVTYLHANINEALPYGPDNLIESYNVPGDIGMNAAKMFYSEGELFARPKSLGGSCGPALASWGPMTPIDEIMPTVIALYRGGIFITAWCGVHTTGVDPVSTDVILEACGPKLTWRLGKSAIMSQVIINNAGDTTSYPIWTVTGPGRSPTFTNTTTGDVFQLNHDLIAGEAVVIDATENAHTVGSTASATFTGSGYMKSITCPTCHGTGVIASGCVNCGGQEICPTCHGSGVISVFVPSSTGSTTNVSGMYNLRFQIDPGANTFWGFAPGANIIQVELSCAEYGKSIANVNLVQRYEGV
jgi:thiol-disulfide isomerase/thioredoxin